MASDRLDHMSRNNLLQSGWLWGVALCSTQFVCSLRIISPSLCWVDTLVSASLLLAVKLLLLGRGGSNVEIRAETLLLIAATLGIDTLRAISMMRHSLLIFWSASLGSCCFLNLSTLKNRVRNWIIHTHNTHRDPFLMTRSLEEDTSRGRQRLLRVFWRGHSLSEIWSDGEKGPRNLISHAAYLIDYICGGIWLTLRRNIIFLTIGAVCNPLLDGFLASDLLTISA